MRPYYPKEYDILKDTILVLDYYKTYFEFIPEIKAINPKHQQEIDNAYLDFAFESKRNLIKNKS